jgi:hypothetical protein
MPIAAINVAIPDAREVAVPACGAWIRMANGVQFVDTRLEGWEFEIDEAELSLHGVADEASDLVAPLADATVHALDGTDPNLFLVMKAPDGRPFIIVSGYPPNSIRLDVLCRYASGTAFTVERSCGGDAPEASP